MQGFRQRREQWLKRMLIHTHRPADLSLVAKAPELAQPLDEEAAFQPSLI
jgi:hypothetical protein